jgi:hypothetical protein
VRAGGGGGTPTFNQLAAPAWQNIAFASSVATFIGQNIGSVGTGNYTIVSVSITTGGGAAITSVEVGSGNFATKAVDNGTDHANSIWYIATPAGGTQNVIVTNGGTIDLVGINVSQVTNCSTLGTPVANTATWTYVSPTLALGTVSIPTNGIAVISSLLQSTAGTQTVSGFTVDNIAISSSIFESVSGHTTSTSSVSPTITFAGNGGGVIAVFSP